MPQNFDFRKTTVLEFAEFLTLEFFFFYHCKIQMKIQNSLLRHWKYHENSHTDMLFSPDVRILNFEFDFSAISRNCVHKSDAISMSHTKSTDIWESLSSDELVIEHNSRFNENENESIYIRLRGQPYFTTIVTINHKEESCQWLLCSMWNWILLTNNLFRPYNTVIYPLEAGW